MPGEAILEGKRLTKRFGGLVAVNDVSFAVHEGEIYGLIGPNGAGKTTLFSCLVGAQAPTAGEAAFRGQPITGLSNFAVVRRGIVRTHQIVKPFREMTVTENVLVGASFGHRPRAGAPALAFVSEILEFCGLTHRAGATGAA